MGTLHAILHWAGTLLGYLLRELIGFAVFACTAVIAVLALAYMVIPIFVPFLKERSPFKKAKSKSKGPINPYANPPCPMDESERKQ
ncbi:MAG: hypothetical protein ABSA33_04875 [Candidatus Micrarchaeaceae archaeon]|jgi:hypothetical protein